MPFSLIKSGPAQSSPTFANAWLHSNRNLSNDGQSGGFKVFSWTILHVTHFFKYFLTVCLPRVIQKFVRNKFRVALTPLWQHFSWNFKISKSVNNEWLCNKIGFFDHDLMFPNTQRRCENVVKTSLLTLSQRGTVENENCADVSFRRCDNVALRRYQEVAATLLQRRHNIKHWVSRPFYYRLFWFLSLHRNVRELQKC